MKWLASILIGALILIALGVGLLGNGQEITVSANNKALVLYEKGTEDMLAYCNSDAIMKLEKALELDPSLAEAKISLVMAQSRMGNRAIIKQLVADADSLTTLIKDDKRRMVAQLRLSDLRVECYRDMRDSLVAAITDIQPDNIYLLISQANMAYDENDKQKAETLYLKILDVDPNYAGSYNMLGYMEMRAGNFDQAIAYIQKYSFLAPNVANPHDSMGEVLMVMGRYEEAEKEFRTSISMQPDFYNSLINLGAIHIARGQMKTGIKVLQDLRVSVAGSEIEKGISQKIISAYHVAGMTDKLAEATAQYVSQYPKSGESCLYRGIRLAYAGQPRLGQAVIDSCVAKWRAFPGYHTRKEEQMQTENMARTFDAIVAETEGEYATAVRMWARVEEINRKKYNPQDRWRPHYYLANALWRNGEPTEALAQVAFILKVNSRQIQALVLATECHLDLGQADKARKVVDQLRRSLQWADKDYAVNAELQRLEMAVSELEGNS